MKRIAGIVLSSPADLGSALADYREMLGLTRYQLAAAIAKSTGRSPQTVLTQLRRWETGAGEPSPSSLLPVLDELSVDLALIPRTKEQP